VMKMLSQDLRGALRQLLKNPAYTGLVVITLALGIGVNTAMFSIVNGFLRPLPVRQPKQIVMLASQGRDSLSGYFLSYPQLLDFRKQANSFSDVFGYQLELGGISADGKASQFLFNAVTGNYFSSLGINAATGRLLLPGEGEGPGADPFLVLGYSYWQKNFGGNPNIVGKQVLVNGKSVIIVGVAPKGFHGLAFAVDQDGYLPLNAIHDAGEFWIDRSNRPLVTMARLKPGVSSSQAQSSVNVIAARLAAQYPATDKGIALRVLPERLSRPLPQAAAVIPALVSLFLVLAALVLLIACINVANISLVRAMVRRREMAVRVALGAGRAQLIRQMLTESLLLALTGGAVGMVLGMWTSRLISSLDLQTSLPVLLDFHFDWSVFAYAMGVTVVTGLIVGLWPALRASSANVSMVLHEAGRSESAGVERHRMRRILVIAQVAGSLLLLVVAALFVRSLQQAQRTYLGFDSDHLLNVTLDPNEIGYDQQRTDNFYRDLKARVLALPGVKSATVAFDIPMGNFNDGTPVFVEGHAQIPGEQPPQVMLNRIDADYFSTLRVPLLQGREFTAADNEKAPLVAIINQTMANQFWPNQSPIGKRFSVKGPTGPFIEVAGVAGDGRYSFIFESPQPHFYVPMTQNLSSLRILQIRTSVQPESLMTPVQQEVRALDPGMPIVDLRTMRQSLQGANGFFILRLGALLAGATGVLGLVLAVVGVYGVLSFVTAQRTREIGIRMALGAAQGDVLRMVLRQGIVIVTAGSLIGLGLAFAAGRAANSFLMVSGADPLTFAVVPILLAAVALWACYIPARRATKVDPMVALRYE